MTREYDIFFLKIDSHSKCDIEILAIMAFNKFKFTAAGNFEGEVLNEI